MKEVTNGRQPAYIDNETAERLASYLEKVPALFDFMQAPTQTITVSEIDTEKSRAVLYEDNFPTSSEKPSGSRTVDLDDGGWVKKNFPCYESGFDGRTYAAGVFTLCKDLQIDVPVEPFFAVDIDNGLRVSYVNNDGQVMFTEFPFFAFSQSENRIYFYKPFQDEGADFFALVYVDLRTYEVFLDLNAINMLETS